MRGIGISLILTITLNVYSFGQNPLWVHKDKKNIERLNLVDKTSPNDLEQHFINRTKSKKIKQDFGFGWSKWTGAVHGGYTSIKCTFYYYKDTIISYSISSRLPDEKDLAPKYIEWFGDKYQIDSNNYISFDFQKDLLRKPISEYNGDLTSTTISENILDYMSPHSGLPYGHNEGYSNSILENRRNFNSLGELTPDEVYILMFSINPASRLTAIEYYIKNSSKFEEKDKINNWIDSVYKELPYTQTLMGCIGETWNSKLLVEYYAHFDQL